MKSKAGRIILTVTTMLLVGLCLAGYPLYRWYSQKFDTTLTILAFTVQSPLRGANMDVVKEAIKTLIPWGLIWIVFVAAYIFVIRRFSSIKFVRIVLLTIPAAAVIGLAFLLFIADDTLEYRAYFKSRLSETHFIEEHYTQADIDAITTDGKPKNLLYIYMESMESAYASEDVGGRQPDNNYIPNLTRIAFDNISFSNSDKLGGFYNCSHTGWTSAALFSTQSGIPFMTPIGGGGIWKDFTNLITIGDILEAKGYEQEFICGSEGAFGGRKELFENNGGARVLDYFAAIDEGYIPEDYYVWWGFEDEKLYDITKQEITKLAADGRPFNMTILTVDTHFDGGYVCDLCENEYPVQIANVVKCADRQIEDFLNWCATQDWYEDTVIVIQGDHPNFTKDLVDQIPPEERTTYNCFINSVYDKADVNVSNRTFVAMDMMPTILSAMGYEIPGDRIGIGTDLFSDTPTYAEEYGFDYLNEELDKHSQWFLDNIVWGGSGE